MRLISSSNEIVYQTLVKRFEIPKDSKYPTVSVLGNDFNASSFHIQSHAENKQILQIKNRVNRLNEFMGSLDEVFGEYMKKTFGDWYKGREVDDVNFEIDVSALTDEEKEKALKLFPQMQIHIILPIFKNAFDNARTKQKVQPFHLPYRDSGESIYLFEGDNALQVFFTMKFDTHVDRELGELFLQEMKDAKRVNTRELSHAPPVAYTSGSVPSDLAGTGLDIVEKSNEKNYSFVSLSLFDRHIAEDSVFSTVEKILFLRPYLEYHLKCSKAYMHIRFRDRVRTLLQNLEASKDTSGVEKVKRTASGKFLSSQIQSERSKA
eukprot:CAMPEP_0117446834 /NCGR_PEP_ID=MMETSP0759-20121206/6554_1 /TAXON_ID=63605 /ORGANISM="Percolomonas cosmopolitus, Strain WS" /LENGTH=320 /DNA_ID=CAMNT_0005239131 /DNA_START=35 /DNA_END=997 /DNA_ORIENTATION=+